MKILNVYKSMAKEMFLEAEVDDDKIIKYKTKDGEQGEMKASSAKTMEKDHPAKIAYDKMTDNDSDSDTSKGQTLGGGDFDRDTNRAADDEADDMDRDARFDADAEDDKQDDDVEISDSNSGPIDTDDISDMLKNDSEIMDKIGTGDDDDLYWDGNDLVSSKFDDATVASIPDDANMTLGDLKQQILDYEPEDEEDDEEDKYDDETTSKITARNNPHSADAFFSNPYETVQINGKKYRPIKESKKEEKTFAEKVKENSKRFAKRK